MPPLSPFISTIKNNDELWRSVLAQMQIQISKASFATWFRNTEIVLKENGKVVISVPNEFSKEWLGNKYYKMILGAIRESDSAVRELLFEINPLLANKTTVDKSGGGEKPNNIEQLK